MASIAQIRRFVTRVLRDFEEGVFEEIETTPREQDEPGVYKFPGHDFMPGAVGELYRGMTKIEWHPSFDWGPLEGLATALDNDPLEAASLDGATLCQLLVAHGRAERFCDGLFLSRVQSGQMRALIARVNALSFGLKGDVSVLHGRRGVAPRRCRSKPKRCTACKSSRVAVILYGSPAMDSEMEREIHEGLLVLGGCCIGLDDPGWQCRTCGAFVHVRGREDPNDPDGMAWQRSQ